MSKIRGENKVIVQVILGDVKGFQNKFNFRKIGWE